MLAWIVERDIPNVRVLYDTAWRLHRHRWLTINRSFGLEVLEQRYGTQLIRLQSLSLDIRAYRVGDTAALVDMLKPRQPFPLSLDAGSIYRSRVATPSVIK